MVLTGYVLASLKARQIPMESPYEEEKTLLWSWDCSRLLFFLIAEMNH